MTNQASTHYIENIQRIQRVFLGRANLLEATKFIWEHLFIENIQRRYRESLLEATNPINRWGGDRQKNLFIGISACNRPLPFCLPQFPRYFGYISLGAHWQGIFKIQKLRSFLRKRQGSYREVKNKVLWCRWQFLRNSYKQLQSMLIKTLNIQL